MTRAEEILALYEVQATKPGAAFKGQYRYNPGAKKPIHLKRREVKRDRMKDRSTTTYPRPWNNKGIPKDKVSMPLDKKWKSMSAKTVERTS